MKSLIFGVNNIQITKGKNKIELSKIAIWNEYGTRTSPPRPAFRMGLDSSIRNNKKLIQAQLKNITRKILTGRSSKIDENLIVLLTQIGRSAKKITKDMIKSRSISPGNAQSTIDRKGFDHPLYETGKLLDNVNYEVIDK